MALLKKRRLFFTGNWQKRHSYLGEPQNILQELAEFINRQNKGVRILLKSSLKKEKKADDLYLVFGGFTPLMIRYLALLSQGVKNRKIFFYFLEDKRNYTDLVGSLHSQSYLNPSLIEIFLPLPLYQLILKAISGKIIFTSNSTSLNQLKKPKDGFLMSSSLEKKCWSKIKEMASFDKKLNQEKLTLVYFGRDDYSRGVDILADLPGEAQKIFYLPFKNYLWKKRQDFFSCPQKDLKIIYGFDQKVLAKVSRADFSVFAFRCRAGGPDIPAALIEAFILGVPPIISQFLYFPILRSFNYPLVLKEISPKGLAKTINQVKSGEIKYSLVMKKCKEISDFFSQDYGYKIEAVAQRLLKKVGAA